jgi:outer membrane protein W
MTRRRGVPLPRLAARGAAVVRGSVRPVAFALLAALALASPARADEREWILSLQPAAALLHLGGETAWGGGAGLDLSYGFTDALAVRVTGAATAHALGATMNDPGGTVLAYNAGAGLTYTIDILRLVPYVDFAIGLVGTTREVNGERRTSNQLGMELGLGVDYLVSRRWAVGFVVRYHAYLTALSELPVYLYFGPRIALHFGG